ncbi:protein of unknown function [Candidatus Bipolaricaulis anaerobius]|uniref:Uncharacterized protein n=1 Tax=Candidatus Bipolaricaulis anaerobius TaxID=2026885 RepID=A0A2X3KIT7_9BACT|nr:protein of unknown function [Candidatus Bipolaricaulis anaerobius]
MWSSPVGWMPEKMRMDDRRQYRELRACPQETLLGNQRDGAESGLVRGMIWLDDGTLKRCLPPTTDLPMSRAVSCGGWWISPTPAPGNAWCGCS